MSDEVRTLVERAKSGDRVAASRLISDFYEHIFAYLRRRCGSDEDAADLTQKTFCKAWSSISNFNHRSSFRTWLHSIAHHVYVDWRRVAQRCDTQSDEWWDACVADVPGPFESAAGAEVIRQVYRAVEQLEEEHRDVIHLHYYQSLTIQETAEALGVATSTVKYRLRNALDVLHARLAEPKWHTFKENS
jgi:RNA polymerase sigma-70 factor, ECF subfamily